MRSQGRMTSQFGWMMFSFTEKGNMENEVGLKEGQVH